MQVGMIGLGRMGGNMVRRLLRGGHSCVVFDAHAPNVAALTEAGAVAASSIEDFMTKLATPRVVWLMVPAKVVDDILDQLSPCWKKDDVVVDGGNSHYIDDIRRAAAFSARNIHYVDAGVSGGVWGLEGGYCLMMGGDATAVSRIEPIIRTLAPGASEGAGIQSTAREACAPSEGAFELIGFGVMLCYWLSCFSVALFYHIIVRVNILGSTFSPNSQASITHSGFEGGTIAACDYPL